jgi:hypothetical protein
MKENSQFTVHHLRFEVEALTTLLLPAYAGPSIRGALFGALQRHFCPESQATAPSANHKAICPVCWLMATEKPGHNRGRDVPRPYTVEPLLASNGEGWRPWRFEPGQRFAFGLTLFAQALNLFPYLVVAMPLMGQAGLGIPLAENAPPNRKDWKRRGQFVLRRIDAINPLTGEVAPVMGEGQTMVQMPDVPMTSSGIAACSQVLLDRLGDEGHVQLWYSTPMRLVEQKHLVKRPWLGPLFRRLLERLDALRSEYAGLPPVPDREHLPALADGVRPAQDFTCRIDLESGSRRLKRATPVGGFVGSATYQASRETWQTLLPYLLWSRPPCPAPVGCAERCSRTSLKCQCATTPTGGSRKTLPLASGRDTDTTPTGWLLWSIPGPVPTGPA